MAAEPSGRRRRRKGSGSRGRPRDPATEERALRAALEIFGQKGLSGLTIDEVAARSKVGKSSIYLRWPDKEALLAAALHSIQVEGPEDGADASEEPMTRRARRRARAASDQRADDGEAGAGAPAQDDAAEPPAELTLRDYLVAHVHRRAELYLGEYGLAMLRLYAEARAHPEMFGEIREQAISRFVLDERQRVAEAIRCRGPAAGRVARAHPRRRRGRDLHAPAGHAAPAAAQSAGEPRRLRPAHGRRPAAGCRLRRGGRPAPRGAAARAPRPRRSTEAGPHGDQRGTRPQSRCGRA